MPWEKQFDIDNALFQAMRTFWSKGYEATSMQDLVESMGINRASLYDTFGDKRSLFIAALKYYDDTQKKATLKRAAENRTPRETIKFLFNALAEEALDKNKRDGCFLVNTMLERAPHDEAVNSIVAKSFSDMQKYFRDTIRKGQQTGEIDRDIDAGEKAHMLLAAMIGLRVLSRGEPKKALVRSIVAQSVNLIE